MRGGAEPEQLAEQSIERGNADTDQLVGNRDERAPFLQVERHLPEVRIGGSLHGVLCHPYPGWRAERGRHGHLLNAIHWPDSHARRTRDAARFEELNDFLRLDRRNEIRT